jgi:hypothetical protein
MTSSNNNENWENLTRVDKLGELLVRFNALKLSQLTELIEEQRKNPDVKLGELAVNKGLITKEELMKFLDTQNKEGKVVNEFIFHEEIGNMSNDEKWERLSQHERLGEILVKKNILKLSQLSEAMDEQSSHPGKYLGDVLIEKGLISKNELVEALEWQEKQNAVVKDALKEVNPDFNP